MDIRNWNLSCIRFLNSSKDILINLAFVGISLSFEIRSEIITKSTVLLFPMAESQISKNVGSLP